jgi:hypothetical protein
VLQAHGLPKVLLQEGVEILAGDLLDDEAQEHVIHVGVDGLGAGLIDQGGLADGLGHLVLADGVEHVVGVGVGQLGDLVEFVVVELGIGGEAGLVLENVGHSQLGLPGLGGLQVGRTGAVGSVVLDFNGLVYKTGEVLGDGIVDI